MVQPAFNLAACAACPDEGLTDGALLKRPGLASGKAEKLDKLLLFHASHKAAHGANFTNRNAGRIITGNRARKQPYYPAAGFGPETGALADSIWIVNDLKGRTVAEHSGL